MEQNPRFSKPIEELDRQFAVGILTIEEYIDRATLAFTQEREESCYHRVLFHESGDNRTEPIALDIPVGLDIDEASRRWYASGGQIRNFNGCGGVVEMKTVGFTEWLVQQEGARLVDPETA